MFEIYLTWALFLLIVYGISATSVCFCFYDSWKRSQKRCEQIRKLYESNLTSYEELLHAYQLLEKQKVVMSQRLISYLQWDKKCIDSLIDNIDKNFGVK